MSNRQIIHDDASYYVFEALFAMGPKREPQWVPIAISSINGWQRWRDHKARVQQPLRAVGPSALAFSDPEVAAKAWKDFSAQPQRYPLRLVRMQETITKLVLFEMEEA